MEEKKAFQRLPKDVVPKNYAVELTPDLKAFTFGGKLRIDAEVCKCLRVTFQVTNGELVLSRWSRRPLAWYSTHRRLLSSVRVPKSQVSSSSAAYRLLIVPAAVYSCRPGNEPICACGSFSCDSFVWLAGRNEPNTSIFSHVFLQALSARMRPFPFRRRKRPWPLSSLLPSQKARSLFMCITLAYWTTSWKDSTGLNIFIPAILKKSATWLWPSLRLDHYFIFSSLSPSSPVHCFPPSGHLSFVVSLVFRSRLPMATESESFHSSTTCRLCCDSSFRNA